METREVIVNSKTGLIRRLAVLGIVSVVFFVGCDAKGGEEHAYHEEH
jgi:hypothetical protein